MTAAMFHLFTHAFFKALLFLAAGSVMHAMGGVIDMRRFGGLRKVLPVTHSTFLCGAAALAGIPLLSGFWSKDVILESSGRRLAKAAAVYRGCLRPAGGHCLPDGIPDRVLHLPRLLPDVLGRVEGARRSRPPRPRIASGDDSTAGCAGHRRALCRRDPGAIHALVQSSSWERRPRSA